MYVSLFIFLVITRFPQAIANFFENFIQNVSCYSLIGCWRAYHQRETMRTANQMLESFSLLQITYESLDLKAFSSKWALTYG